MPPPRGTPNPVEGPGDYSVTTVVHNDSYPAISPLTSATHTSKSILVTGASRGLGLAMAISFARAGASQIAIAARSPLNTVKATLLSAAKEAKRPPPHVLEINLDITSQESTEAAAKLVEKEFGKLDVLVNNAGVLLGWANIAEGVPGEWWGNFEANLKGPYLVTRALLPLMLRGGDKTIITVSSVGAHKVLPGLSGYQTSKLAVLRLMEFVSTEYGDQGVTAFSIHPGNIPTDMVGGPGGVSEELKHIFVETPELSADTIVFLTREKREWIAGRYINCTWDMPDLMEQKDEIVKGDKLKVRLVV